MGKVLVVKGANFAEVSVGVTPLFVNDIYKLKEDNFLSSFDGYFITSQDLWRNYADNKYLFWSVKAGQVIDIVGNEFNSRYVLCTSIPITGKDSACQYMSGGSPTAKVLKSIGEGNPHHRRRITEDGYIGIYSLADGVNSFPESKIIRNIDIDNRTFEESDATGYNNLYIRTSGDWGTTIAPTGKHAGLFFNVYAGESITIDNNSDGKTIIGLVAYSSKISEGDLVTIVTGGERRSLPVGEKVTLNIPEDCWLYVQAYESSTKVFPNITLANE